MVRGLLDRFRTRRQRPQVNRITVRHVNIEHRLHGLVNTVSLAHFDYRVAHTNLRMMNHAVTTIIG